MYVNWEPRPGKLGEIRYSEPETLEIWVRLETRPKTLNGAFNGTEVIPI